MNGLLLHTGGLSVSWDDVRQVRTPDATDSHVPIPHHELVGVAFDVLKDRGWNVVNEAHALSKNGQNYFGLMELDRPEIGFDGGMTRTLVGLRNSHIFQYSAAMALGGRVFVCDNLCFTGEVVLGRKHTKNILRDIYPLMSLAVAKIQESREIERERFAAYQRTDIDRKLADHLLLTAVRANALPPSVLGKVIEDVDFPGRRHPEFEPYKGSLFGLYMASTEHTKGSLPQAPKRCMKLHSILDPVASYAAGRQLSLSEIGIDADEVEWKEVA